MASFGPLAPMDTTTTDTPSTQVVKAPKKPRKKAAVVVPEATTSVVKPKRARTAFLFYSNMNRSALREAQPGLKITDAAVILGKQWKALTDAEKAPYQQLAADDKAKVEAARNAPSPVVASPPAAVVVDAPPPAAAIVVEEAVASPAKGKKRTTKK